MYPASHWPIYKRFGVANESPQTVFTSIIIGRFLVIFAFRYIALMAN